MGVFIICWLPFFVTNVIAGNNKILLRVECAVFQQLVSFFNKYYLREVEIIKLDDTCQVFVQTALPTPS